MKYVVYISQSVTGCNPWVLLEGGGGHLPLKRFLPLLIKSAS